VPGREHVTTTEIATQFPDRMRRDFRTGNAKAFIAYRRVLSGGKGWDLVNGRVTELPRGELPREKERLYADWVVRIHPLKAKGFRLAPLSEAQVNGKTAVGVRVSKTGHPDIRLYFDKQTGLPVKRERQVKGSPLGGGPVKEEVYYDDYREAKGIKYPGKVTTFFDGKKEMEFETVEFRPAEKLDARLFARP
jgi:hypothetical protein